jgi:hypothetical protein
MLPFTEMFTQYMWMFMWISAYSTVSGPCRFTTVAVLLAGYLKVTLVTLRVTFQPFSRG